jgi:hypothetical protein
MSSTVGPPPFPHASPPGAAPRPRNWRQYSIRSLLAATTVIAVVLSLPGWATFTLAWLGTSLLIPVSIVVLWWGGPADRATAVGVLSALVVWAWFMGQAALPIRPERGALEAPLFWGVSWGWIALAGFVSRKAREVAIRRAGRNDS